jgi:hypothetical protein
MMPVETIEANGLTPATNCKYARGRKIESTIPTGVEIIEKAENLS